MRCFGGVAAVSEKSSRNSWPDIAWIVGSGGAVVEAPREGVR